LKKLLNDQPGKDAAILITDLIIERQLEKIRSKSSFKESGEISEEEKW